MGLANALGLFDENMHNLIRQINGTLGDINETMRQVEQTFRRTGGKSGGEREVS